MREEKELEWLINLFRENKLSDSFFSKGGGSIDDFENVANSSFRDKGFRKWFKEMLELEIINFVDFKTNSKGYFFKFYVFNKTKALNYLRENEVYQKVKKFITFNDL